MNIFITEFDTVVYEKLIEIVRKNTSMYDSFMNEHKDFILPKRQRRQLYALGSVLSRRFHMCSIDVKNTLFRSFCTPMYTCQLWLNLSVQSMHTLNVAYNNAFRFVHHLPTYCSASLMFVVNHHFIIRQRLCPVVERRPQHVVSK